MIWTRDDREQTLQVAGAGLEPGTAGLRVRRAHHLTHHPAMLWRRVWGAGGGGGEIFPFFFSALRTSVWSKNKGLTQASLRSATVLFLGEILTQFPSQQAPQTVPQCNLPPTSTHSALSLSFKMTSAVDDKVLLILCGLMMPIWKKNVL